MSTYSPRSNLKPRNIREAVEDSLSDSGATVRILRLDERMGTIRLDGSYADILLAKKALRRFSLVVNQSD